MGKYLQLALGTSFGAALFEASLEAKRELGRVVSSALAPAKSLKKFLLFVWFISVHFLF